MKRFIIIILAFLYIGLASGVVVNFHYCMGQLSSVEYGYDKHGACGKCGMTEKEGCCKTESKVIKLNDSHQWAKTAPVTKKIFALQTPETSLETISFPKYTLISEARYHSPPDQRINCLYLHTGILRI